MLGLARKVRRAGRGADYVWETLDGEEGQTGITKTTLSSQESSPSPPTGAASAEEGSTDSMPSTDSLVDSFADADAAEGEAHSRRREGDRVALLSQDSAVAI